MQRKKIREQVLKTLFALSGNCCAYPNCDVEMVDENERIIGEICHIEAAEEGGLRYNKDSNDEDRRALDNLILLCPNHHKKIDKDSSYSADAIKKMKREHEDRCRNKPYDIPDRCLQKVINIYGDTFTQSNSLNSGGTQVNIQAGSIHYQENFKEEEELSVIDEMFDFVLAKIKEGVAVEPQTLEHMTLDSKIRLNFKNEIDQEEIRVYARDAFLKRKLIKQCYQSLDTECQKDLHSYIFGLYRDYSRRDNMPNIQILTALFDSVIPGKKKSDPTYNNLAKALVLFFFEDCTIFEKSETEKLEQQEQREFKF